MLYILKIIFRFTGQVRISVTTKDKISDISFDIENDTPLLLSYPYPSTKPFMLIGSCIDDILDGNSEIGAHVWSPILSSFKPAHHVLSYHFI